jgi:hypothetical protein
MDMALLLQRPCLTYHLLNRDLVNVEAIEEEEEEEE